ncbi:hypothetical protein JTB14_013481 [Gonioctena quinquepunctata]|nr:hypothetical protein JTB14_013481 [Gonioctena quinquepunctata]
MEIKKTSPPLSLIAKVSKPPASLYPEVVAMQLDGQTDISVEEVATNTSPKKNPSCLYPIVVITTQLDGQAKGKDTLTELSPDEEKVRDRKPKTKSLPQIDGPTDPSSDDKSTDEGNSPITKRKTKNKAERGKLTKSPKSMDVQGNVNSSMSENENTPATGKATIQFADYSRFMLYEKNLLCRAMDLH